MRITFTGTRKGMTPVQKRSLRMYLMDVLDAHRKETEYVFIHGDCVGADAEAAMIAKDLGYKVWAYPSNLKTRAWTPFNDFVAEPDDPLKRNRTMVDLGDRVFAAPHGKEVLRSGTWSAIRYAKKAGKPIRIMYPQGNFEDVPEKFL